ncbi:MAG: pre-peptidase C-terminal domain-containing protein, partial [Actinomycetota bacterium]|nr:pre-peptidase C-terminal domain-containing protein [Actinomycetota bacterium]
TLDRWDDVRDVYRVRLRRGQRLRLALDGPAGGQSNLYLWRPGTRAVAGGAARRANRLAAATRPGSRERLGFRARHAGAHYVEVRLVAGRSGPYRLGVAKR